MSSIYANLSLVGGEGVKKASPFLALVISAIAFSMYIVGFVIDNKCVKNKGNEKTYRAMKWVLALGLCSLITMFLTILIASTGKPKMNIDPRLLLAAGIVTFICTIVGSGYGIWASLKCEDKLKRTRLGLHIFAIVFALGGVIYANKKSVMEYGSPKLASAREFGGRQATAARGALARAAARRRAAAEAAAAAAQPATQL